MHPDTSETGLFSNVEDPSDAATLPLERLDERLELGLGEHTHKRGGGLAVLEREDRRHGTNLR